MPLNHPDEASAYFNRTSGRFFNLSKDLQPGQSWLIDLVDVTENTKTKYPIAGKTFCYRLTFLDPQGETRIMDVNGSDAIAQVFRALYPNGHAGGLQPGLATLTRRAERSTKQANFSLTREKAVDP